MVNNQLWRTDRQRAVLAEDLAPRLAAVFEKCARPPTQELECRLSRAERLALELDDCERLLKGSSSTGASTAVSSEPLSPKDANVYGNIAGSPVLGGQKKGAQELNEVLRVIRELTPAFSEMVNFRAKTEDTYFMPNRLFDGSIAASKVRVLHIRKEFYNFISSM